MIRAFLGIALPEEITFELMLVQQALPLGGVVSREAMHLTLLFLGNQTEDGLEDLHHSLTALHAPRLMLSLSGLGVFGGAKPRLAYAGLAPSPDLIALQARVARAARMAGIELERRRYTPHVTLARMNPARVDRARLETAIAAHAGFATAGFEVTEYHLYSSHLHRDGAQYEVLASYRLGA